MAYASLLMNQISSWDDFHEASRKAFGFPDFYGRNNNAWIDCLSYLDQDDGMSAFSATKTALAAKHSSKLQTGKWIDTVYSVPKGDPKVIAANFQQNCVQMLEREASAL